jgi:hypothetical protein
VQAFHWYKKAAAQGLRDAQNNVGTMYLNGEGTTQDFAQAFYWYQKAAAQGDVAAQFNLGLMYHHGLGTAQDDNQALYWYRKAAAQGDADAQNNLAVLEGNGGQEAVPKQSKWASFFGALNTVATVANNGMTAGSSLYSAEHGGGVNALVNTVQNVNAGYNGAMNSGDNGDTLATLADTLQKTQSTINLASGSGSSSGGSSSMAAANACSTSQPYMMYLGQCRSNHSSQAPCYQAAAALCQCYVNADPSNPSVTSWQACVTNNTASANSLRSSAPTIQ